MKRTAIAAATVLGDRQMSICQPSPCPLPCYSAARAGARVKRNLPIALVAVTVLVWEIAPTRGDELPLPDATTIESTDDLPIPPSTMRPVQWANLGSLGPTGLLVQRGLECLEYKVLSVEAGSPAHGKLLPGDHVVGVDGKHFQAGDYSAEHRSVARCQSRMRLDKGIVVAVVLAALATQADAETWNEKRALWFDAPAENWREALPVGNGRLGGMVLGTYPKERIQLNEDSIWAREPMMRPPEIMKDAMEEVQRLVNAGRYEEAHKVYQDKAIIAVPRIGSYQTLGDLWIEHVGSADLKAARYYRELDLATGVVTLKQPLSDGSVITEEVLSTAVDNCIAVRLSSTSADGLNFDVSLTRPFTTKVFAKARGNDELLLQDQARYEKGDDPYLGTKFHTALKVIPEGGSVKGGEALLHVRGAKAATLLLTCSTDYNRENPQAPLTDGWQEKADADLARAAGRKWTEIRTDSANDVSALMYRCDVELGSTPPALQALPTDQRLKQFAETRSDPGLMEVYFQLGRYLLVSSSRPGTLPANLQGIWAEGVTNPWRGDYHLNINIQMCYWLSELTNLSECHEPFLWLMDMSRTEGRPMAKAYGAKGFCTSLGTNPWGRALNDCSKPRWAASHVMGPWGAMHIMEHYRFNGDEEFLWNTGFPILKESCEFVQSWLVRDPKTGKWVGRASASHETGFQYIDEDGVKRKSEIGPATAYDLSIFWQVMSDYLEAAAVLRVDDDFTRSVQKTLAETEYPRIGTDGHILEWGIEVEEVDVTHRHLSHLVGLHPGLQITQKKTPELFEAARKSLIRRGDKKMGWSQSWKVSCYARVFDGNKALDQFNQQLTQQTLSNLMNLAGGVLILDGNYGTPAGMAEMLLQSHDGDVHLLPALPDVWKNGSAKGLMARGAFQVDLEWEDGRLKKAEILSREGGPLKVRYGSKTMEHNTTAGQRIAVTVDGRE